MITASLGQVRFVTILLIAVSLGLALPAGAQTKIMPLGNSITEGIDGPSTDSTSYRNDLFDSLSTEITVDFVGSLSDGTGFDADHEGHSGFRADQVLFNINTYLSGANPNVVILHIGTNDISNDETPESTRDEIGSIIDAIDSFDSTIKIILCSVLPRTDAKDGQTDALNLLLEDLFFKKRDEQGRNLYYAGTNELFKQNPIWATDYFDVGDDVHPNDAGFNLMARVLFDAVMVAVNSTTTLITDNFEKTFLGVTWDADAEYVIQTGDLANTAGTGTSKWEYMAVFRGVKNPTSVGIRWGSGADAAGINEAGLALLLDAPSQNADGYLAWIRADDNMLRIWTITNGVTDFDLNLDQPSLVAAPQPGDKLRVDVTVDASNLKFDFYLRNDEFAGSVTTANPGVGSELYSGFISKHNLNNNITDFFSFKTSDGTPPDPVGDLAAGVATATSVPLSWTASGDDGSTGIANMYDLRYSTSPIDASNFDAAVQVQNVPAPATAGTLENLTVSGLQPGTQHYFALKVIDDSGNVSGISNVVIATTEAGNVFVDNFNRTTGLGADWVADPAYDIVDNRLSNTATDGAWDDIAVLTARKNPVEVSFKFGENTDAGGIDESGFVLVFGSASATSSGYAITRRTAANEIRLWRLVNGEVNSVIQKNQSPALSPPSPGDIVKVQISSDGTSNKFDVFVNGVFDGSVEDTGLEYDLSQDYWGGVTLRSNLNNDIDDFAVLLEIGAPANLVKVSGDAQIDTVGQLLSQPLVVRVTDDNNSPVPGVNVDFAVIAGGGSIDVVQPTGDIVVEAESGILSGPMVIGDDVDASNGKFIEVPNGAGGNSSNLGLAEYTINIGQAGDYTIWGRAIYPDANADAFRVIVDADTFLWDIGQRDHQTDWHWDEVSNRGSGSASNPQTDPVILSLSAGLHTLKFQEAKDGARLDQLVIAPVGSGFQPPANQDPVIPSGKFTDQNGEATANLTLGLLPGNNSVRITVAGLTPQVCTATGVPDSVATITKISGDQATGLAGQPLSNPFVVELRDKHGNLAAGAPLTFSVLPPGNGTVSTTNTTADALGLANTILTLATTTVDNSVQVTALGYTGADVIFTASAQAGDPANIELFAGDNQTASFAQTLSDPLQVRVTDDNDLAVSGHDVTFSVVEGDGNIGGQSSQTVQTNTAGIAEVTPTVGSVPGGTNRFEAASTGLTGSPVVFTAITAAPQAIQAVSDLNPTGLTNLPLADSVEVRVVDALGVSLPGYDVTFGVTGGDGQVNGGASATVQTNANGVAKVEWRLGATEGSSHTLNAASSYQSSALDNSPLQFTATAARGPGESFEIVSGNDQTGLIGQPLADPLVVRVLDSSQQPVANWPVAFTVTAGGGSVSVDSTFTDSQGRAETVLTLGSEVGSQNNQMLATAPQAGSFAFVASADFTTASTLALVAGVGQAPSPAGLPLPEAIQVRVTDDAGGNVAGIGVTFRIKTGGGTIDGTASSDTSAQIVTDQNGLASATWFLGGSLGQNNQSLEITASNGTGNLNGSPIVVFATATPGSVDADVSTISSDKTEVDADGQDTATITVTARDKFGNAVPGETIILFSSATNDVIVQPQATNVNGEATGTIASTEIGVHTISARAGDSTVLTSTAEITFNDVVSVELASFSAKFSGFDGVRIQWLTSREINNLGFNILRGKSMNGTFTQVNPERIQPNARGEYVFFDREARSGGRLFYMLEDVDLNGARTRHGPIAVDIAAPDNFELTQNYPNPFNPETKIRFQLPAGGRVVLMIFDVLGRQVRTLVAGERESGYHEVVWDARNDAGKQVSSGIYYYRIVARDFRETRRMLLAR